MKEPPQGPLNSQNACSSVTPYNPIWRSTFIMRFCPSIAALLFSAPLQADNPGGIADSCCAALSASSVHDRVIYPSSEAYTKSLTSYYSRNAQLSPACIVQPQSAEDVSTAVSTLVQQDGSLSPCRFAIRSGGHTTWTGAASIDGGVTIDLSTMNSTVYHPGNKTASISPGARWQTVYKKLEKDGVIVAGGRAGPVGAGGFLLGGGNSFHASRFGFACDTIVNFQVILASGAIVNANKNTNPDLFKALKGGSSNFGIVTRFDMKTFPHELIWGGLVTYDNSTTPQQISAAVRFTDNIHKDPYASWIGMWSYNSEFGKNIIASALHYTKPMAYPAAYDDFLQITNTSSSMRMDSLYNFTQELGQPDGYNNIYITNTHLNNAQVVHKAVELHNLVLEEAKAHVKSKHWSMILIVQPWPVLFAERGLKTGGNVLGLERFDQNMIQFLFDYTWDNDADTDLFRRLGESITQQVDGYAKMINADNEYIYLNYADGIQNPLKGYGEENVKYIRRVANKYDPHGVFQYQVPGGFKISVVK